MTDRIRHLTITLDQDYRDDDVQPIITAIEQIRGVTGVEKRIVTLNDRLAAMRVEGDLRVSLHKHIQQFFTERAKET